MILKWRTLHPACKSMTHLFPYCVVVRGIESIVRGRDSRFISLFVYFFATFGLFLGSLAYSSRSHVVCVCEV